MTTKNSPDGARDYGSVKGLSNGTGGGSLAYQQITDGSGTEELSQQSVGMPTPKLAQETNGNNTISTTNAGGNSGGYVMNGKKEPGVWGSDGLLAIPHVKMVLFLVCVVQVR